MGRRLPVSVSSPLGWDEATGWCRRQRRPSAVGSGGFCWFRAGAEHGDAAERGAGRRAHGRAVGSGNESTCMHAFESVAGQQGDADR